VEPGGAGGKLEATMTEDERAYLVAAVNLGAWLLCVVVLLWGLCLAVARRLWRGPR
jgi:hypothetical protein